MHPTRGSDVKRKVNRGDDQQAETLLRWFHMEALLDGEFLSWRETASGFQLFVNGVYEGEVTYGELRLLAVERLLYPEPDERLTPVPDTGHLVPCGGDKRRGVDADGRTVKEKGCDQPD